MKWNGPRTCVRSHELGLKFRAERCSLAAVTPHPVTVQIPPASWGAAPGSALGARGYGGPPGCWGWAHPTTPAKEQGAGGAEMGSRGGWAGPLKPTMPQRLAAPSLVPPWSKTTCSQGGRGKGNLTFRGTDSYFHSEPASCRSPPQAAFDGPTDFYCFQYCLFHYLSYRFDLLLRRWILGGLPKKYSGHKRRMAQNHLIFNHRL